MAVIDLLKLQPHKVSRDLSGYLVYIYGPAGVGKTTFGSKMPKPLLLAAEKGYNSLPGVYAQDITSWADMRSVLRELKKPEVKEMFSSVVVDTVDLLSGFCEKYVCSQLGIDSIGEGGWSNNGWSKYKKEFEDVFRTLAQLGYAVVFISHSKERTVKPQQGESYQIICPTLQSSAEAILENMCDLIGYAHPTTRGGEAQRVITLRSNDGSIVCKSRFSKITPEVEFSYESLSKALIEAIDSEAKDHGNQFITDEKQATVEETKYDHKALMEEFHELAGQLINKDPMMSNRISKVIEKYLGKGKKISETTPEQAEFVYLIVTEIKEDLMK